MKTYDTCSLVCSSTSRLRMLACTDTSSAEAGSSQTTRVGSPAKARAMAMRCFWPPESSVGFCKRKRGSTRTSAESLSTLARTEPLLAPPSLRTARVRMARVLQAGLSVESGFWKTIWMARSASCERLPAVDSSSLPSKVTVPESAAMRPVTHLASVVLPLPDSPTRPKVSPLAQAERDVGDGGELLAAVLEGASTMLSMLEHVATASHAAPRGCVASTGVMCGISRPPREK